MQKLFLELMKLSLNGTLFALSVMLVRLIFRKAPKWLFCLLWGVVALRLVCPISIESNFSLVPDRVASGQIITNVGEGYLGEVDIIYESNAGYSNAVEAGRQPVYSNDGYYVVTEKDSLEAPKTVGETVFPVLSWIWLSGTGLMLAYTAVSYLVLRKRMAEATHLRDNIWQCEQVDSPFVLGIIKPRIYLPYTITDSDMANVIAHEQAHIHRKDHWWKPIGFLLLSVHWFNPILWLAYILLCRDIEAACDEKVIKHMGKDEMRAYSTALLHCSVHRRRIAACPLAFGEVGVKERIKRVMNYKKPAFWIVILMIAASVIAGVLLLTSPADEKAMIHKITDREGYTIFAQREKTVTLSIPVSALPANMFSQDGVRFAENEIVAYRDDTATVYLKGARYANEGNENLYFWFGFLYDLPEQGGTTIYPFEILDNVVSYSLDVVDGILHADNGEIPDAVHVRGLDGDGTLWYYISTGALKQATGNISFDIRVNSFSYLQDGALYEEVFPYEEGKDRLLELVDRIVNNPECGLSSNPYTYIEAKRELYDEILSYKDQAVSRFVGLLRAGENGLRGYIMAAACSEITGIGEKVGEYDTSWWATAQEWLDLYDAGTSQILPNILSRSYVVEEVTYKSGIYSFSIVAGENSPIYAITEDMTLLSQKEYSEEGTWAQLGALEVTELTKENFDALFMDPGIWADNANAYSIRNNTENAWKLIYNQEVLYYVLQQKNGDLYLAYGYTGFSKNDAFFDDTHIRWLYKLAVDTAGISGMVVKSGESTVPMLSFPKKTAVADYVDSVCWLTINFDDEDFVPFSVWKDGEEVFGSYAVIDATTYETLKYFMPSGLEPQTYLFQNADPTRSYIVLLTRSIEPDAEVYAFGARFNSTTSSVGGGDGSNVTYSKVKLADATSGARESYYKVSAGLPATDLSAPGQILADKVVSEWNAFDGMTQQQQWTSSHLWGTVYINTDTWRECEQAIGVTIDNPLEAIRWINKTGYLGMESVDPSTPVTHVHAIAYATHATDRKLSEINVTAGYHYGDIQITLTATVSANDRTLTVGSACHGYATYAQSTTTTGSGAPVLIVTPNKTNNTGYYNGDYFDPTAYWVKDNVFYKLRVFGDAADQAEIQATLDCVLAEI